MTDGDLSFTGASVPGLDRRFEAVVLDWDGTAVADRRSDATAVRTALERACAAGLHVAVVSGTHLGNVDGQLVARPGGPGRLSLHLNRGSETYAVSRDGPRLVWRRQASRAEQRLLDEAASGTAAELARHGLHVEIISSRLNRRKIDLIPEAAWADPPKARIGELLAAVERRLASCGFGDLAEIVDLAGRAAATAGLASARITSDAKHIEIGLTDKSDAARSIAAGLWRLGVGAGQVLVLGDEFGALGEVPGSDSLMRIVETHRSTFASVGPEPAGVPSWVIHVGGGPDTFLALIADQVRRRQLGQLPLPDEAGGWTIEKPPGQGRRAAAPLFTLADGRLGTTGGPLWSHQRAGARVLMAGVYEGRGAESHLVACPVWHRLGSPSHDHGHRRWTLDLHAGVLWDGAAGRHERDAVLFASRVRGATAVLRVACGSDAPPLEAPTGRRVEHGWVEGTPWMRIAAGRGGVVAAARERRQAPQTLDRYVAYHSSSARLPAPTAAIAAANSAAAAGFDRLLDEHRTAWARRWQQADVRIVGDDELQRAVRFALFHLMSCAGERGEASVGARGLSGPGYRGHVFWDADVFVLPFLAATHPASARAMLAYRLNRLPAAMAAARAAGWAGARFPWESTDAGTDVTPSQVHDPVSGGLVRIRTGEIEEHIVADVAWAASCYVDWTGDTSFWRAGGSDLVIETARYWASRARWDRAGAAHLDGVIGPDEYHELVDDNAFTNVMARWNLRRAAALAEDLALVGEEERRRWLELADALVDGYDVDTRIYEQFAGFMGLDDLIIRDLAPRRPIAADLLLGRDRVRAAQVVKQADVLMLHHLVPEEVEPGSLDANLDFYEPRTAHGSSLSPGVHAALLARAGRPAQALEAMRLVSRIDLDDLSATTAAGLHIAAMGSLWQAIVMGFLGVRASADALLVDPRPAREWRRVSAAIRYHGRSVAIEVEGGRLSITAGGPVPVAVAGTATATVGRREAVFVRDGEGWSRSR